MTSERADSGQVANGGGGDGGRAGPDEEEKGLARPALRWFFAEEAGPLSSGQVGLSGAKDERVGPAANRPGGRSCGAALRGGDEIIGQAAPQRGERCDGVRQIVAFTCFVRQRDQRSACLAESQGRGFQPSCSRRSRRGEDVLGGAGEDFGIATRRRCSAGFRRSTTLAMRRVGTAARPSLRVGRREVRRALAGRRRAGRRSRTRRLVARPSPKGRCR